MIRLVFTLMLCAAMLVIGNSFAQARRVALVIGIDDYTEVPKLAKAVGDAKSMSQTLEQLGFDVTRVLDGDRRALNIAISEFTAKLTADDIAFVHFSGHGVEIAGENFLLPADIPKPKSGHEDAVKYEAIGLQRLISQIAASGARTRLFVIDACRNNPFQQSGVRAVGAKRGLAYVAAPAGTFVMYSAGYGQLALDRLNSDDQEPTSVYTRVLTKKLLQPGLSVSQIAQNVRGDVQRMAKSVGHDQRPAYYDELSGSLVLNAAAPSTAGGAVDEPRVSERQIELTFWNSVKDGTRPEVFELYLKRYPNGGFARLARLKIEELKGAGTLPEAAPPKRETRPEPPAGPDRAMVRAVQQHLNRLGCSAGAPDGAWGRNSSTALRRFARYGKVKLTAYSPSQRVLDILKSKSKRVCPCPGGQTYINGKCARVAVKKAPEPQEVIIEPPKRPQSRAYVNPRIGGVAVDICASPKRRCKGAAAHLWCKSKGYARAQSWAQAIYPKTRHVAGGECIPAGFVLCGGYSKIVCSG